MIVCALCLLCCASASFGQDSSEASSAASTDGLAILQLTTSEAWLGSAARLPATAGSGADGLYAMGSTTFRWLARRPRTRLSLTYTPVYSWMQGLQAGEVDHNGGFQASYDATPRTTVSISATASLAGQNNTVFPAGSQVQSDPSTPLSSIADPTGQINFNTSFSSTSQALLAGKRLLTMRGSAEVRSRRSPLTDIAVVLDTGRTESPAGAGPADLAGAPAFPSMNFAGIRLQVSHRLSQRTQIGIELSGQETLSTYEQAKAGNAQLALRRSVQNWIQIRVNGGISYLSSSGQLWTSNLGGGPHPLMGAGIRIERKEHLFGLSLDRSTLDPYGAGASSALSAMGTWFYRPQGKKILMHASAGWQRLSSDAFGGLTLKQFTAALSRRITTDTDAEVSYTFASAAGWPAVIAISRIDGFRLSIVWRPAGLRLF